MRDIAFSNTKRKKHHTYLGIKEEKQKCNPPLFLMISYKRLFKHQVFSNVPHLALEIPEKLQNFGKIFALEMATQFS